MAEPVDKYLYSKIKTGIYKKYPKHSAYRSGIIVKKYKKDFAKIYGKKSPYKGKKTQKKGLARWFKERWLNQRGKIGYKYKSDIYRPTQRITSKTPVTFRELTKKQINRARSEKRRTMRVKRFRGGRRKSRKIKYYNETKNQRVYK